MLKHKSLVNSKCEFRFISFFLNPAVPAAFFLYGLIFLFAIAYFAKFHWTLSDTVIFYSSLSLWIALIAWGRRSEFISFVSIDILFLGFIITVFVSMVYPYGDAYGIEIKDISYLLFLVCTPYYCGRIIRTNEVLVFSRILIYLGLAILVLMGIEIFMSPVSITLRWLFFGINHSPLLLGSLLSVTLMSLVMLVLSRPSEKSMFFLGFLHFIAIGLISVVLVLLEARGWVILSLIGISLATFSAKNTSLMIRLGLLLYLLFIVTFTMTRLSSDGVRFYGRILIGLNATAKGIVHSETPPLGIVHSETPPLGIVHSETPPLGMRNRSNLILEVASCQAIDKGQDSTEIRHVLYHEAYEIFMKHPIFGVGASRFGKESCGGRGSFPHSTILQAFAELGLMGGGLLIVLFLIALITLVRRCFFEPVEKQGFEVRFVLVLYTVFLLADQIYGNYFMMVATCTMLGVTARIQSDEIKGSTAYDSLS